MVAIFIFSLFFSVIGFLATFILNQILKSQDNMNGKLIHVLGRLEAFSESEKNQNNQIEYLLKQLTTKCDGSRCKNVPF